VLIVIPDETAETNRDSISIPVLGSFIASMSIDSKKVELADLPPQARHRRPRSPPPAPALRRRLLRRPDSWRCVVKI